MNEKLAKELSRRFPRSPRETLGGYVIAGRALDKCRALLAGEYNFDCSLDGDFSTSLEFKSFVAEGATDAEVADWIGQRSKVSDRTPVIVWNNKLRNTRLCDMPAERQIFLEDRSEKPARVCLVRCLRSGGKADLSSGNKPASLLV
jgi:Domain of unknown function (DUF5069)